jgi:hypothetical protein
MLRFSIYLFQQNALHVSGGSSAHHQEFKLHIRLLVVVKLAATCCYHGWDGTGLRPVPTQPWCWLHFRNIHSMTFAQLRISQNVSPSLSDTWLSGCFISSASLNPFLHNPHRFRGKCRKYRHICLLCMDCKTKPTPGIQNCHDNFRLCHCSRDLDGIRKADLCLYLANFIWLITPQLIGNSMKTLPN